MDMKQIVLLGRVFGNVNRVRTLQSLLQGQLPVVIAEQLRISRAGLQMHLDFLIEAGLIQRDGSGRGTRFISTEITEYILSEIGSLTELMKKQQQLNQMEATLETLNLLTESNVEISDAEAFHAELDTRYLALRKELAQYAESQET